MIPECEPPTCPSFVILPRQNREARLGATRPRPNLTPGRSELHRGTSKRNLATTCVTFVAELSMVRGLFLRREGARLRTSYDRMVHIRHSSRSRKLPNDRCSCTRGTAPPTRQPSLTHSDNNQTRFQAGRGTVFSARVPGTERHFNNRQEREGSKLDPTASERAAFYRYNCPRNRGPVQMDGTDDCAGLTVVRCPGRHGISLRTRVL